jgi:hypothetical protein
MPFHWHYLTPFGTKQMILKGMQETPPMADTSTEALDALMKKAAAIIDDWEYQASEMDPRSPVKSQIYSEAKVLRDTIAALRAAPVAARERAAEAVIPAGDTTWKGSWLEPILRAIRNRILALPLDAPTPVATELPPCCVCGSYMATRGEETLPNGQWVCCAKCKADAPASVDPVVEAARVLALQEALYGLSWAKAQIVSADAAQQMPPREHPPIDRAKARILAALAQEARHD